MVYKQIFTLLILLDIFCVCCAFVKSELRLDPWSGKTEFHEFDLVGSQEADIRLLSVICEVPLPTTLSPIQFVSLVLYTHQSKKTKLLASVTSHSKGPVIGDRQLIERTSGNLAEVKGGYLSVLVQGNLDQIECGAIYFSNNGQISSVSISFNITSGIEKIRGKVTEKEIQDNNEVDHMAQLLIEKSDQVLNLTEILKEKDRTILNQHELLTAKDEIFEEMRNEEDRRKDEILKNLLFLRSSTLYNKRYLVSRKGYKMKRDVANKVCQTMGGYLVEINSLLEFEFVVQFLSENLEKLGPTFLIGAEEKYDNEWGALTTSDEIYIKWRHGLNTVRQGSWERCVFISVEGDRLMDINACDMQSEFICELPLISVHDIPLKNALFAHASTVINDKRYMAAIGLVAPIKNSLAICRVLGGHLPEIINEQEFDFVNDYLNNVKHLSSLKTFAIGHTNEGTDRWVGMRSANFVYNDWFDEFQTSDGRHCAKLFRAVDDTRWRTLSVFCKTQPNNDPGVFCEVPIPPLDIHPCYRESPEHYQTSSASFPAFQFKSFVLLLLFLCCLIL